MLEPNSRQRLFDLLRPPPDYTLDRALGTTFTLDLPTLLTVPLAMLRFDWQSKEGHLVADPIALLEGLRQTADRIVLFCQHDRIRVPREQSRLFAFLESTIIPVSVQNGVFHPKVWVLRFKGPENSVRYRLLCLTRNLTPDRSWDTVLTLEGDLKVRANAYAANHNLGNFVRSLPGYATRKIAKPIRDQVDSMQEEIRRVEFALPEGFDEYHFWFSGNGNNSFPFRRDYQRIFVISPFLEPALLERIAGVSENNILVSRLESLQTIEPKILKAFKQIYYMNPLAENEDVEANDATLAAETDLTDLNGLHAKLFVTENGWDAHVFTGSPNATNAAFSTNVEFLVQLTGKKSRVGIDSIMSGPLTGLFLEYKPGRDLPVLKSEEKAIEVALNQARSAVASGAWEASVTGTNSNGAFQIELQSTKHWSVANDIQVLCAPITQANARVAVAPHPSSLSFSLSLEALTSFFGFALSLERDKKTYKIEFALNVPLSGLPSDRMRQLLFKILENRAQVLRLLMLMLADDQEMEELLTPQENDQLGDGGVLWRVGQDGLFEALVRALDRHPEKLERVTRLINDLSQTEQGRQLLPVGLEKIWTPIQELAMRLQ